MHGLARTSQSTTAGTALHGGVETRMDADRPRNESDDLARERTLMAAERTLMAWIRTSLSMIGFGFGIDKIVETLRSSDIRLVARLESGVRWFGIGIVLLGIYSMWASLREYRRMVNLIAGGTVRGHAAPSLATTVGKWLVAIGTFAFLNLLWNMVR
jgi:putative membrane protein